LKKILITALILFLLTGCNRNPVSLSENTPTQTSALIPTATQILTLTPTASPTPTTVPLVTEAYSPLQGIAVEDLYLITSQPYKFDYPFVEASGSNYNHTGLDLAFFKFEKFSTVLGHPIQAVLPGTVVESLADRWPYGNMIMIETPFILLSPEYLARIPLLTPYTESEILARSTCQPDQRKISWSQTDSSIYIVYAHMQNPSPFSTGDIVSTGQVIGAVGSSGNALVGAEHLHLEVRIGPSDAKFGTISDYKPSSTQEERYNYCIWALSEVFQPIDPALLWKSQGAPGQ